MTSNRRKLQGVINNGENRPQKIFYAISGEIDRQNLMTLFGMNMAVTAGCPDRDHAAVSNFAVHVFELNGGVVNVVSQRQQFLHLAENNFAFGGRNIVNPDVAGERMCIRSDA